MAAIESSDPPVEWGGRVWQRQLAMGLEWLGDVRGQRVLDIGTRYGRMAVWFAEHGAEVVGLDVTDEPLVEARGHARARGVEDRVDFQTYSGDPEQLPAGFDLVFAKSTIVLLDPRSAVEGLHASLRPAGRILIVENARGPWPLHVARMIRRRSLRPHGAHYFTAATIELFRDRFDIPLLRWSGPTVLLGGVKRSG